MNPTLREAIVALGLGLVLLSCSSASAPPPAQVKAKTRAALPPAPVVNHEPSAGHPLESGAQ